MKNPLPLILWILHARRRLWEIILLQNWNMTFLGGGLQIYEACDIKFSNYQGYVKPKTCCQISQNMCNCTTFFAQIT